MSGFDECEFLAANLGGFLISTFTGKHEPGWIDINVCTVSLARPYKYNS